MESPIRIITLHMRLPRSSPQEDDSQAQCIVMHVHPNPFLHTNTKDPVACRFDHTTKREGVFSEKHYLRRDYCLPSASRTGSSKAATAVRVKGWKANPRTRAQTQRLQNEPAQVIREQQLLVGIASTRNELPKKFSDYQQHTYNICVIGSFVYAIVVCEHRRDEGKNIITAIVRAYRIGEDKKVITPACIDIDLMDLATTPYRTNLSEEGHQKYAISVDLQGPPIRNCDNRCFGPFVPDVRLEQKFSENIEVCLAQFHAAEGV